MLLKASAKNEFILIGIVFFIYFLINTFSSQLQTFENIHKANLTEFGM